MTTIFHGLLAKLEEHRADPLNSAIIRDFHELAAGALPAVGEVLDHVFPKKNEAAQPAAQPSHDSSPVDAAPPGLPPELRPPSTNWGTNQRLNRAAEARQPTSPGQVRNILAMALNRRIKAKPIGTSHSSSNVFATSGVLVDSGALIGPGTSAITSTLRQCRELVPGFYRLSEAERGLHIEIGSGAQVKNVNDYLAASGRALAMTGAYTGQTLVGAFCTSTHGAGIEHPPLHSAVRSIQLITVDENGAVVELRIEPSKGITDPEAYARGYPDVRLIQDDTWFAAVIVAIGTMGFITSMILHVRTAFSLKREDWKGSWHDCRAMLLDVDSSGYPRWFSGSYHWSVTLNPYAAPLSAVGRQKAVMSRMFIQSEPPPAYNPPSQAGLSELLVSAARLVGDDLPPLTPFLIDFSLGGDPVTPTWGPSYQVLGNPNNLPPGFSAEYAFPLSTYMDAVDKILARMATLADHDMKYMVGGISLRWVGKDSSLLSMSEGSERVYMELLCLANAGRAQEVLAEVEPIALEHGGRPHWGQWFSIESLPRIIELYPRYPEWREIYRKLNVSGLFSNDFTDHLP